MISRPLVPRGGNDRINTPDELARRIVDHFLPCGRILEPCRGAGAFSVAMPECDWCEIDEGRDFFTTKGKWDWIVTNPPWSRFRDFLLHGMSVADNIVFLATTNHWMLKARRRDMKDAGFGLVEIAECETPPLPWPQSGFQLSATWARRGWSGPCNFTQLK